MVTDVAPPSTTGRDGTDLDHGQAVDLAACADAQAITTPSNADETPPHVPAVLGPEAPEAAGAAGAAEAAEAPEGLEVAEAPEALEAAGDAEAPEAPEALEAAEAPPPASTGGRVAAALIGMLVPPALALISTGLGWAMVGEMTTTTRMWPATAVMLVTMALRLVLERVAARSGTGSTTIVVLYAGHLALVAVSVGLNPLACIYAFVGYLDADRYLDGRLLYPLVVVTATLCAIGQTGGYHVVALAPLLFVGLAAVNLFMATAMVYLSIVREREMAERERTLAALEQANRKNSALQEELLARARESGISQERGRLSREIHDTVAQGLVGVIRQLETVGGELATEGPAREEPAREEPGRAEPGREGPAPGGGAARQEPGREEPAPGGGADRRMSSDAVRGDEPAAFAGGDGSEVRRRIAIAEEAARDCLVEARRAVEALAPQQLTDAGTAEGLGELVARWARTHRIVATFDADDAPCHGAHAAVLVRIAQEALANVSRHSGASTVTVTLSGSDEEQSLQVSDDGHGFDAETISRGHGLANMEQRVRDVGGRLHVSSHQGVGTTVIATVPR